jgi:phenylacetic acid degradation operon negative regulatory protein
VTNAEGGSADDDRTIEPGADAPLWLRPQSLMFTFLGDHIHRRNIAVFSGSIIGALGRVGVAEQATRSTLSRMVRRGLLERQRHGRRAYFALTPRTEDILADGGQRIWHTGAVNTSDDRSWTLVGFSFPDAWQRQRHDLRSKLTWAGFGPLQNGLWLAPSEIDLAPMLDELGLLDHVKVFVAEPRPPTDIGQLVRDAFDLDTIASWYHEFLERWDRDDYRRPVEDPLALTLRMTTEWLNIIRKDPRLPIANLPDDWPAVEAQHVFHELHERHVAAAEAAAADVIESIPVHAVDAPG